MPTPINAASLVGLPYPVAIELARQINGTPDASALGRILPGPVAVELFRQMTAKSGEVSKMMISGISPQTATALKTAFDNR